MTFNAFIKPTLGYVNLRLELGRQVPLLNLYLLDNVNEERVVNYSIHVVLVLRPLVLRLSVLTHLASLHHL